MTTQTQNRKKQKPYSAETITSLIYWLAIAAMIFFAYLNIAPYMLAVKGLVGNDNPVIQLLQNIPFLGEIFRFLATGFNFIMGTILWGILQTLQLFPIFLKRDRRFIKSVIQNAENHTPYHIKDSDDKVLQALKRWYNRFPIATISQARYNALFAYIVDFCICLFVYPPVAGGIDKLGFVLMSGQFTAIDWRNVVLLLLTIYTVEILVSFIFWLSDILIYIRMSARNSD